MNTMESLEEVPPKEYRCDFLPIGAYQAQIERNQKRKEKLAKAATLVSDKLSELWDDTVPKSDSEPDENDEGNSESNSQGEDVNETQTPNSILDKDALNRWRNFARAPRYINDRLDIFAEDTGAWLPGKVVDISFCSKRDAEPDEIVGAVGEIKKAVSKCRGRKRKELEKKLMKDLQTKLAEQENGSTVIYYIRCKFDGWSDPKWDVWIELPPADEFVNQINDLQKREDVTCAPVHTFTIPKPSKKRKVEIESSEDEESESDNDDTKKTNIFAIEENIDGVRVRKTVDRFGVENATDVAPTQASKESRVREARLIHVLCVSCHDPIQVKLDKSTSVNNVSSSNVSKEVGVTCMGPCGRLYCKQCVTDSEIGKKCRNCTESKFCCAICNACGPIGISASDPEITKRHVFQCRKKSCGRFYHLKCLKTTYPMAEIRNKKDGSLSILCPVHDCSTCHNQFKFEKRVSCEHCPRSYHLQCCPPSLPQNEYGILCEQHRDEGFFNQQENKAKLGNSNEEESMSSNSIDTQAKNDICQLFETMQTPTLASRKNHFELDTKFITEQMNSMPDFQHLRSNVYVGCKPIVNEEEVDPCTCKNDCTTKCHNRVLRVECTSENCGTNQSHCSNRKLQDHKFKKTKPIPTVGRGWGLVANEDIEAGDFVIEYVGEVLSDAESNRRLMFQAENNDHHVFHMQLMNDRIIDARYKGNVSRFMNHSCDPNCELQKWIIKGYTRIGIFAVKDIRKGDELTYDYKFHSSDTDLRCLCGTEKCRGSLACVSQKEMGEKHSVESAKTLKRQVLDSIERNNGVIHSSLLNRLVKKRDDLERRIQHRCEKERSRLLHKHSYTSATVPGDLSIEVAKGYFPLGSLDSNDNPGEKRMKLPFLARNARRGEDFIERQELLCKAIKKRRRDRRNEA